MDLGVNRILIAIQARNKSTRLPDKISLPFGHTTVLGKLVETCKSVNPLPKLVEIQTVVISSADDPVYYEPFFVSKTPANDLVSRYNDVLQKYQAHALIRLTADCPLIPRSMIESVIVQLQKFDYVSNVNPRTFPDGFDCQGISSRAMQWIFENQYANREHPFYDLEYSYEFERRFETSGFTVNRILNHQPTILNPYHPENKLSIDTQEDYQRCLQLSLSQPSPTSPSPSTSALEQKNTPTQNIQDLWKKQQPVV